MSDAYFEHKANLAQAIFKGVDLGRSWQFNKETPNSPLTANTGVFEKRTKVYDDAYRLQDIYFKIEKTLLDSKAKRIPIEEVKNLFTPEEWFMLYVETLNTLKTLHAECGSSTSDGYIHSKRHYLAQILRNDYE